MSPTAEVFEVRFRPSNMPDDLWVTYRYWCRVFDDCPKHGRFVMQWMAGHLVDAGMPEDEIQKAFVHWADCPKCEMEE